MKTNSINQDNEFYILQGKKKKKPFYKKRWFWVTLAVALLCAAIAAILIIHASSNRRHLEACADATQMDFATDSEETMQSFHLQAENCKQQYANQGPKFCESQVVAYNGFELKTFHVFGGTASLQVGPVDTSDSTILLAVRAADIREDNGGIVGAFVDKGQLLSQGKAKKGFCAIINGKIIIGAAENSPYLEEAINNGGYFFRQYPLVVDGMAIENKPKGTALRRALCEKEGTVFVVECDHIAFHDFSQLLVDYGVTNAIYLVGSDAFGFYRTHSGECSVFGNPKRNSTPNITYMVWR